MLRRRVCLAGVAAMMAAITCASSALALPASFVGSASYRTNANSYLIMRARLYHKKRKQFVSDQEWSVPQFVDFVDRNVDPLNGIWRYQFSEANEYIIILKCSGGYKDENIRYFTNINATTYPADYLMCR